MIIANRRRLMCLVAACSVALLAGGCAAPAPPPVVAVPQEEQPPAPWPRRWLPLDERGWTVLRPSADSRILYVSAAGDDDSAVAYEPADRAVGKDPFLPAGDVMAFRTVQAAMARARAGHPDWVLLRRGDTFEEPMPAPANGRGPAEPSVLASYGPADERPVIIAGRSYGLLFTDADCHDVVVLGLDFYSRSRDPGSDDYVGLRGRGGIAIRMLGRYTAERVLVEDCRVRWASYGMLLEATRQGVIRDVVIRRNVIVDAHGFEKSQGLYSSNSSFLLEENIFDHNGWSQQAEGTVRIARNGQANMYNHNTYLSNTHHTIFRRNVFLRPSSIQNKFTANYGEHSAGPILVEGNLYVDGEIGIAAGGNRPGPLRFRDVTVRDNVLLDLGRARPTNRHLAWYVDIQDWDGGEVTDNLLLHQRSPDVLSTVGIVIWGRADDSHTRNVEIRDNILYNLRALLAGVVVSEALRLENVRIADNAVQFPGLDTPLVRLAADASGLAFNGNGYFGGRPADGWFAVSPPGFNHRDWINISAYDTWPDGEDEQPTFMGLAGWRERTGEADARAERIGYPDPSRTIETYMEHLGMAATQEAFFAAVRRQSKAHWRPELTARAVNAYIRAGFAVREIDAP